MITSGDYKRRGGLYTSDCLLMLVWPVMHSLLCKTCTVSNIIIYNKETTLDNKYLSTIET